MAYVASVSDDAKLLAQIYADPTDRLARSVYWDWLHEREDPRARVMALQRQEHRSREERDELDALIRQHVHEWIGPAAAICVDPTRWWPDFEEGFLSKAELRIESEADRKLAAEPVFATLRWLTCEHAEIVLRPNMKLLRVLSGSLRTFGAVCELPYELDVESVFIHVERSSSDLDARVINSQAPVFRKLQHLHVDGAADDYAWILRSWIPSRVHDLGLGTLTKLQPWMHLFVAHPQINFILARLPTARLHFTRYHRQLEVKIDGDMEASLAWLDDVDGTGWHLTIEYDQETAQTPESIRQRFGSFSTIDFRKPFVYDDD
jgi:uncharacterized protein (TIGR02996 family)